MATQLQIRRGTSTQVAAFTGAEGEIVVNTTNDSVHVNDGSTAGGFELARADLNNVSDTDLNAALTGNTVSALTVTTLTTAGVTTTGDISFGDNDKAIFGAGSDLSIFHSGSRSTILDSGTGALRIAGTNLEFKNAAESKFYANASDGGAFNLYYDNAIKLATTATGIDVTGTVASSEMTVADTDDIRLRFLNATTFKAGIQVVTSTSDMISGSAVDDLAIRSQANMLFSTGGNTERMAITSAGDTEFSGRIKNTRGNHQAQLYGTGDNVILRHDSNSSGLLALSRAGSLDVVLDASGRLLIGSTGTSFGERLTVNSNSAPYGAHLFAGSGATAPLICRNQNGVSGSRSQIIFYYDANARGSITSTSSATAYNTSSDQRLKENIADADDAGSRVDAIQVRKFDWIVDGSHQDYGMVAQELQTVAPEAVSGDADSDEMMGVDYSKLVPMLLKEIQSLRARVAQLENN